MARSGRKTVMVCFLPASSELLEKSVLNTMAAKLAPAVTDNRTHPMVHAELFFPEYEVEDTVGGQSCGIHYGGTVFMAPKTFSRKNWLFRSISVTRQQYDKLKKFCTDQVGGGFNYLGYYAPCSLFSGTAVSPSTPRSWYCSELTAGALQNAGVIEQDNVSHLHPELLYQAVMDVSYVDCGRNICTGSLHL